MIAKNIHGWKTCIKCRHKYKLSDVFSKSVCPICNADNRELLSWSAYILDLQFKGIDFKWNA